MEKIIGKLSLTSILVSLLMVFLFISCKNKDGNSTSVDTSKLYSNINGRNDHWRYIGPGGGGAMFNPTINPLDHDHVFVSCDMTGSFVSYDAGKQWRMFNLRGVTKFYDFDYTDENIVYTGTSNMLFKSKDKGISWETIFPKPEDIVDIVSQGDHANEKVITKDSVWTLVEKLAIDPDNPQKLYLLTRKRKVDFWPNGKNQRFYMAIMASNDGGESWETMEKLRFDLNNLFIDPSSPEDDRTIYISGKSGLGARRKGTWVNVGLPEDAENITQVIDGFDRQTNRHIIYAISGKSYFNPNARENSNIYMTNNGGESWSQIDIPLQAFKMDGAKDMEYRSIATSYYHPENIYVSYANLKISQDSTAIGVAKSSDYGKTWELVWKDVNNTPTPNIDQGWLNERFGPGWGENPFHMAVADDDPNLCYTTDFGRTVRTKNGGKTWEQLYTNKVEGAGWRSRGLQVTTGYMLAFDPFDSLHVLMADTDTGMMESHDGTKSWSSATNNNGVPRHWVNSTYWVQFDPEVKDKVWAVMSANHDLPRPKMWRNRDMSTYKGGILSSTDGGKTWEVLSEEIGEMAPTHLVMDPNSDPNSRILYVCAFGKGVYKSIDGGKTWHQKNKGFEGSQPAAWRLTLSNNGDLYLVVFRKSDDGSIGNDKDGSLYKSTNGAESWEKVQLPNDVNGPSSLLVDPVNSDRLLLSAWGRFGPNEFSNDVGGGIYLSTNGGGTWKPVLTEDQHIHDLTMDEKKGVLYASGFNSSVYRSEDRGETWQRIKGYNFKWGKRVQPDPMDPEKVYIITFGGGIWHGPAQGDENALEDIVTPEAAYE
ncbi:WD40/YVTN/BNR-like repeat-containing protein [Flagellimonas iocasae]|uniref:Sortilin N-terminal domain-containing protein n=1 Tax=Flagellimonas iocasae TaxID=2055905 RepID=A0ABW4Y125_9FLAO